LWKKITSKELGEISKVLPFTEIYDLLEIEGKDKQNYKKNFRKIICDKLKNWSPDEHHRRIVNLIKKINAPILTTNFDQNLEKCLKKKPDDNLYGNKNTDFKKLDYNFTDYYPWESYYTDNNNLNSPLDGFGIWHINGMIKYERSIKMGLSQYLRCTKKAIDFIHFKDMEDSFSGKNSSNWKGRKTWLQILFNKSLLIFGIGLGKTEIFLRWLLIQRKKYYNKFPIREQKAWYVDIKDNIGNSKGKQFFLEKVGIDIVEVKSYDDIYESVWEANYFT